VQVTVQIQAPSGFGSHETVLIIGEFQDGTPGIEDSHIHLTSTIPTEKDTWGRIKALFGD